MRGNSHASDSRKPFETGKPTRKAQELAIAADIAGPPTLHQSVTTPGARLDFPGALASALSNLPVSFEMLTAAELFLSRAVVGGALKCFSGRIPRRLCWRVLRRRLRHWERP